MTTLFLAILSLVASPALAAERPVHAGLAASPALASGVAAAFSFSGRDFVGFEGKEDGSAATYSIPASGQLAKDAYSCRFRQDEKGLLVTSQCEAGGARETFAYTPGTRVLPLAKFEETSVESAELFAKKFGQATRIEKARVWQTGGNVELALSYTPAGQPAKTAYMMCHQHGSHFDCHTQSRPGPNQPSK